MQKRHQRRNKLSPAPSVAVRSPEVLTTQYVQRHKCLQGVPNPSNHLHSHPTYPALPMLFSPHPRTPFSSHMAAWNLAGPPAWNKFPLSLLFWSFSSVSGSWSIPSWSPIHRSPPHPYMLCSSFILINIYTHSHTHRKLMCLSIQYTDLGLSPALPPWGWPLTCVHHDPDPACNIHTNTP